MPRWGKCGCNYSTQVICIYNLVSERAGMYTGSGKKRNIRMESWSNVNHTTVSLEHLVWFEMDENNVSLNH